MQKRLLITGASGFLGWNLCQLAQDSWEVHGTCYRHPIELAGVNIHALDLTMRDQVWELIDRIEPHAIIHTAAASSPNFCQQYPDLSYAINVEATRTLAQVCNRVNIPLVFTSTDLVFDGTNPPYRETDRVCPINLYGVQKITAEQEILTAYPQATICRMPLMFGMAPPTASSFIQPWLASLQAGETLKLFVDEFRTPISVNTAFQGLSIALQQPGEIIHLGGKERVSRYDFGCILAQVFDFSALLLSPISQRDLPMAAPRAADVSLDIAKALSLGYAPSSIRIELEAIEARISSIDGGKISLT